MTLIRTESLEARLTLNGIINIDKETNGVTQQVKAAALTDPGTVPSTDVR